MSGAELKRMTRYEQEDLPARKIPLGHPAPLLKRPTVNRRPSDPWPAWLSALAKKLTSMAVSK